MSTVRLLFAPENIGFADKIARALAAQGYEPTADEIPSAATLVVWSPAAAASPDILAKARAALARRTLIPVALGKSPPPPSFEHLWPMDLAGWSGAPDDPRWRFVLDEVELAVRRGVEMAPREERVLEGVGAAAATARAATPRQAPPPQRRAYTPPPTEPAPRAAPAPAPSPAVERVVAEPAVARAPVAKPRIPRAAIAAAVAVVVLPLAAFFAGTARGPAEAPAEEPAAPVVAFVEPDDQPAEEIAEAPVAPAEALANDAIAVATETAADEAPPEDLREGDATGNLEMAEADPQSAEPFSTGDLPGPADAGGATGLPIENDPAGASVAGSQEPLPATATEEIAQTAPSGPDIKPATIASLAEAAIAESGTAPATTGAGDPIAELAAQTAGPSAQESAAAFGNYFRDCFACPDMAEIQTASAGASAPGGFAIGVREVTFEQWNACVADGACPRIAAEGGGRSLPVIKVSHGDALSYVAWLSARTGVSYRLPSEAEWEYAARAGGEPLGAGVPDATEANIRGQNLFRGRTTPAGSFEPNAYGVYDMAGNVWEWTDDCAAAAPATAPTAAAASVAVTDAAPAPDPCASHIVKGGAFDTPASSVEGAYRAAVPADARRTNTGFRVARDVN